MVDYLLPAHTMDFWFLFKKISAIGLAPVSITIELAVIGLFLVSFSRRGTKEKPKMSWLKFKGRSGDFGTMLIVIAVLFLYLCSIEIGSHALGVPLEETYAPLPETLEGEVKVDVVPSFIVVLPGGHRNDPGKPGFSQLERKTLVRLIKGVHYWKQFPDARMVFTGLPAEVKPMKEIAIQMGVDPGKIVEETESRDTKDHARYLRETLLGQSFFLVTSANHMPRSVALFKGQGLSPTPAPTDFCARPIEPFTIGKLIPQAKHLRTTDEAFHEHIGMGWAALRRQLSSSKEIVAEPSKL